MPNSDYLKSNYTTQYKNRASLLRHVIKFYQDYISALKPGPSCRFDPTCSNYALTAYSRYGFFKGTYLTILRLARCGPWHPGGWDPVPPCGSQARYANKIALSNKSVNNSIDC